MVRVIFLTVFIMALMVRSLLSQDLDVGGYQVVPNVVIDAPDEPIEGWEEAFQREFSVFEVEKEEVSSEVDLEDPSLEPWEIEQLIWEQELMEDGAFGC